MTQLLTIAALWILAALVLCLIWRKVSQDDQKMSSTATDECWEKGILEFRARVRR